MIHNNKNSLKKCTKFQRQVNMSFDLNLWFEASKNAKLIKQYNYLR